VPNPFFQPLSSEGVPDFDAISSEHYREAFKRAFAEHDEEIGSIVANPASPTFANTLEALERAGSLLKRVEAVFSNLTSAHTNDALEALDLEISPQYAVHQGRIFSNPELFARVRAVEQVAESLEPEQQQLLQETHKAFVRAGAELDDAARARVDAINEELATLTTQFGQNVLRDTNSFELFLEEGDDVAGLPDFVLAAARAEAAARGSEGGYLFTLSRSSITPFLQYSTRRGLREQIYQAYTQCGQSAVDNHVVIRRIVSLRAERARLLGFATHADYMLDDRMARQPANVMGLLQKVWEPCRVRVAEEAADLQAQIHADGEAFELQPWDWHFYTQRIRQERFKLDENEVKPYFKLESVRDGAFEVARKLYGITFHERSDLPCYHPDVIAYEVREADGSKIGIFLFDFYMRPSKRSGAWMSVYRSQSKLDGHVQPVIVNCCNFPKTDPCLLGMDEVRTLFHEFGHGLHGLLSDVRYEGLSGTNVKQDFVELPSQIMEHWAIEPEVLRSYARHCESGQVMPEEMISKLRAAQRFNQGFATSEYLAACFLDMAWHGEAGEVVDDVDEFESQLMRDMGMISVIDPRYRSSYFQHIFSDDYYSAGYYVYMWAEVLDADGFEAFKEKGLFDQATAKSFRENILARGGTADPMQLYRAFRGRDPEVEPLLHNRGFADRG
jgi:peptidyl-dipeptidase Dcp